MKFQSGLDCYQNMRRWEKLYSNFSPTKYNSLSNDEKSWLQAFNETLRSIHHQYSAILDVKNKELQSRVADTSDWLMDFNLEYVVTFYLRTDDEEYEDQDDNILMQIEDVYSEQELSASEWVFDDTEADHTAPDYYAYGEHYCYLYNRFYFYTFMDFRDLFRVGGIYIDIKIEEQSGILPVNQLRVET
jgi:hypothetical protein